MPVLISWFQSLKHFVCVSAIDEALLCVDNSLLSQLVSSKQYRFDNLFQNLPILCQSLYHRNILFLDFLYDLYDLTCRVFCVEWQPQGYLSRSKENEELKLEILLFIPIRLNSFLSFHDWYRSNDTTHYMCVIFHKKYSILEQYKNNFFLFLTTLDFSDISLVNGWGICHRTFFRKSLKAGKNCTILLAINSLKFWITCLAYSFLGKSEYFDIHPMFCLLWNEKNRTTFDRLLKLSIRIYLQRPTFEYKKYLYEEKLINLPLEGWSLCRIAM